MHLNPDMKIITACMTPVFFVLIWNWHLYIKQLMSFKTRVKVPRIRKCWRRQKRYGESWLRRGKDLRPIFEELRNLQTGENINWKLELIEENRTCFMIQDHNEKCGTQYLSPLFYPGCIYCIRKITHSGAADLLWFVLYTFTTYYRFHCYYINMRWGILATIPIHE